MTVVILNATQFVRYLLLYLGAVNKSNLRIIARSTLLHEDRSPEADGRRRKSSYFKLFVCYKPLPYFCRTVLRSFWEAHPDAEQPLNAWYDEASRAKWRNPTEIKSIYRNASIIANNRVVFNIKGNNYRLIVHIRL